MHYKKAPRLREAKGCPPSGSVLHLYRMGDLAPTARGTLQETNSKQPEARPARSGTSVAILSHGIIVERSSPSRVRFAAPNNGAPLTAAGRSAHFSARKEWGSPATEGPWKMSDALTVSEARPGLKMVNAFGHRQSPERM
jgi:hypothetical protein